MAASDRELLDEFVRLKSDAAFAQITARYGGLVYTAACRQVRDPVLAEDVAQATFIVLARRAASVPAGQLPGWLLLTARYCARDALRKKVRREHHEQQAASQRSSVIQPSESSSLEIAVNLDDALARLRGRESTAVALRYLQNQPMSEVAEAMGITVNAAQKVVARALAKLRRILSRKGVILPSVAVLATMLRQLPAEAAPATLAAGSAQGVSIAKGAMTMMRLTQLKWAAAIAVAVLTGTAGVTVLDQALAQQTPDAPAAAIAREAPEIPMLELVGCRIKENIDLHLTAAAGARHTQTLIAEEYPEVHWTLDEGIRGKVGGYSLTVASSADPGAATTLPIAPNAVAQALQHELETPGDYILTLQAVGADKQTIAAAEARVTVKPLPFTQIMLHDVQPDGSLRFTSVFQTINQSGRTITEDGFRNSNFVQVDSVFDEQGNPMRFTTHPSGDIFQYHYWMNDPVLQGQPVMIGSSGTMSGLTTSIGGGIFKYSMDHSPGSNVPTRRVELYELPPGARLLARNPENLATRTVDGRVEILVDTIIPTGGSNRVEFRYRLAAGK